MDYVLIFAVGLAVGFILAKFKMPVIRPGDWRIWHILRYRREHRKFIESHYFCNLCHAEVGRKGLPTKVDHFHAEHPEYRFEVEHGPWHQNTYRCLVCRLTTGGFKGLIKNHLHPEVE